MTKPTLEDIETLALGFAKSLIANNKCSNENLSEKSIELALMWINQKDFRKKMIDKINPNWVDLSQDQLIDYLDNNFNLNDEYWFIEKNPLGCSLKFDKLGLATYYPVGDGSQAKPNYKSKSHWDILYILKKADAKSFSEELQPNPPNGITLIPKISKF